MIVEKDIFCWFVRIVMVVLALGLLVYVSKKNG